ncbi:glycosyl hydrolase-related protein, partial [Phocaeicola vulgatus]|nr:glycosyl hydrolase-related protein [Phocaeicola vulgatus]
IKLADDGSGDIVARLYEAAGAKAKAMLHVGGTLDGWTVRETNTLEQDESYPDEPAGLIGGKQQAEGAELALNPFQLTT